MQGFVGTVRKDYRVPYVAVEWDARHGYDPPRNNTRNCWYYRADELVAA